MLEGWLEQQARDGWVPKRVRQWSSLRMRLYRTEPQLYRYFYDLRATTQKDYISSHEAFGWEYVGQMASSHLWRKSYKSGEKRPVALSDNSTIHERDIRFGLALSFNAVLFGLVTLALIGALLFANPETTEKIQLTVAATLLGACTLILVVLARRITRRK